MHKILAAAICLPLCLSVPASAKMPEPAPVAASLVDINHASESELKALPGIGDATATKIIAGRPYSGKDDLVRRNIIPRSRYDVVSGKIIARQK